MRALIGWVLRFRLVVLGLAAAAMLFGATQLSSIPVQPIPDFTPPYVEVRTEALGLAADEVEQLITVPLEADLLHGVAFLDEIHSESIAGLSSIVLVFDPGTDIFRARQVVAERLTQAHALPNVSRPPEMLQPLASDSRVLMVALRSSDVSLIDLSILAHWTISPRLTGVPGVANVSVWGQRERQLQVLVDPERLRDERVALQHVIENVGNALWVSPLTYIDASTPGTGGFIDTPNQRLGVQHILPIRSPADLAEVPLAPEDTGGRIVRLGDVATLVEDHQPLIGDAVIDGGDGLLLVIERFPDTDVLSVTRGIEDALAALQPGLPGIEVDTSVYRPATSIEEAMGGLALAIVAGFVLALVAVAVLRLDWRLLVAVLVAVPLALAGGGLVLYVAGETINAISVAGLLVATAVIIDDAVAGTDVVLAHARAADRDESRRGWRSLVMEGTLAGRGGLGAATLIGLLVAVPGLVISGVAGAFLPGLIAAYAVAVLVSALIALTVTPALTSLLLEARLPGAPVSPVMAALEGAYVRVLSRVVALRSRALITPAIVTVAVLAVGATIAAPHLGDPAMPTFASREVLIRWDGAPGTSHAEMSRIAARAIDELRAIPGVATAGAHVGRAVSSDEVASVNAGELWLTIDGSADRRRVIDDVGAIIADYPGLDRAVTSYAAHRLDDVFADAGDDLVVRVYGHELDILRAEAEALRPTLAGIAGVGEVAVREPVMEPTIEIEVDLDAAQGYGIKAGDVRRAATTLLSGIQVGNLYEDQKVFEVVVWGAPESRQSVSGIGELVIQAPGGAPVRLAEVADVRIAPAPSTISREGVFRYLDIGLTVADRDPADVARDAAAVLGGTDLPLEYHAVVLDSHAGHQERQLAMLGALAAVVVGTVLLIQATIGSWRRAMLVAAALPMALVGAVVAAAVGGEGAAVATLAGGLGVLAFAARAAISLAERYRLLEQDEGLTAADGLIEQGAVDRLPAILTTTATAVVFLLPMAVLGGGPGLELVGPMAVVLIGGLLTTALAVLFVVPVLILVSGQGPAADPVSELAGRPSTTATDG